MFESAEQILGRQHFHPRGRELEGERQCVEPPTNRRHGGAVRGRESKVRLHVPNPFHEESHRGRARQVGRRHRIRARVQRERSDGVLPLSPHTQRARLVASTRSDATDVRRSATSGAASRTCSKLSSTSNVGLIVARDTCAPRQVERRDVRQPERLGNRRRDECRIPNGGQRHEHHAGRALAAIARASSSARRVFPAPPGPVSVMRRAGRISEPVPQRLHVGIAAKKGRQRQRQRRRRSVHRPPCRERRPRASEERVTGRTGQVKRRGQRAHGLDMGPPSFPALQRAHGMDRQARNRREFFLREARSLAERLELRAK